MIKKLKEKCTGCSACESICPVQAIRMELNKEGFYEPKVNESCIECRECMRVCPIDKEVKIKERKTFYGWHKEKNVRELSSSGGVFRGLSDEIISQDGIVISSIYADDFSEVVFSDHKSVGIEKLQKSKYIASNASGIFSKIKGLLDSGKLVLFSAAPCQIAGLIHYLKKPYENLITVDFVCGGMPSVTFWREHIQFLKAKYGAEIKRVDFRSKRNGWGKCFLEIGFKNDEEYFVREYLDSYYNCFLSGHASVRKICLSCEFHDKHYADLTIADFWGYKAAGIIDIEKGLSLILANTEKGLNILETTKNIEKYSLDNKYSDYAVGVLVPSEQEVKNRDIFFERALKVGFENAAQDLYSPTKWKHLIKYIKVKLRISG